MKDNEFYNYLRQQSKGDLFKASVAYCKSKGWDREDWYTAWQTTNLPNEVEEAVKLWQQDS